MKINPDTLHFFSQLLANNNRDWFNANKDRWNAILADFTNFTQALIEAMTPLDPGLKNLQAKQCIYRIYRDLRFTTDKRPYKTHIACFLYSGGDRTQCSPGYYLQVGFSDFDQQNGCSLGGGFFMPSAKQLAAIRQEIFRRPVLHPQKTHPSAQRLSRRLARCRPAQMDRLYHHVHHAREIHSHRPTIRTGAKSMESQPSPQSFSRTCH